jgi:ElaA protein
MDNQINFTCCTFEELSLDELYEILRLRQEVFIVEQECAYLDADGKDKLALHVLGKDIKHKIRAYARIFPSGIAYTNYQSIGRIITSMEIRGTGTGKKLVKQCITYCKNHFGEENIKISAQSHLIPFYNQFGFREIGDGYLEDNIPHQAMVLMTVSA